MFLYLFFFFKQKTAYELRISDWSSDVCSSDLSPPAAAAVAPFPVPTPRVPYPCARNLRAISASGPGGTTDGRPFSPARDTLASQWARLNCCFSRHPAHEPQHRPGRGRSRAAPRKAGLHPPDRPPEIGRAHGWTPVT